MSTAADPFDLERFVKAQDPLYPAVTGELRRGRKTTHWIWFIFPQHRALGRSTRALRYGIESLTEAQAYLAHPLLGPRLRECARLLLHCGEPDVTRIMPSPDDVKLQSSMTLFARAASAASEDKVLFGAVLERFFAGEPDHNTLALLAG